jgi:hypothetical protein
MPLPSPYHVFRNAVHSISTSVPKGSSNTATHVRASMAVSSEAGGDNPRGDGTYRLVLPDEELIVCLVNEAEVAEFRDVDVHLDHITKAAS